MNRYPVGTVLALELPPLDAAEAAAHGLPEGHRNPWSLIRVNAVYTSQDAGEEPIVAPIDFSNLSSPRVVSPESLEAVGYRVVVEGDEPGEWVTPTDDIEVIA